MTKLSMFIVGAIVASLFVITFGLIMVDLHNQDPAQLLDESDIALFNKLNDTQDLSASIKERTLNMTTDRSVTDVLGNIFLNGLDTVMVAVGSFDIFYTLVVNGLNKLYLPGEFIVAFTTIAVILVFLGVILSAILGRDT